MKNVKVTYDPEADVLSLHQLGQARIDHATEMGNIIVHFSENEEPVLIEILNAAEMFELNGKSILKMA